MSHLIPNRADQWPLAVRARLNDEIAMREFVEEDDRYGAAARLANNRAARRIQRVWRRYDNNGPSRAAAVDSRRVFTRSHYRWHSAERRPGFHLSGRRFTRRRFS